MNPEEMMTQTDFAELMKKIESENAGQEKYAKKQYRMSQISALCSALILVIVIGCVAVLLPRIVNTLDQLDTIMSELETVTSEISTSIPDMINDVNSLVSDVETVVTGANTVMVDADKSINEALGQVTAIDIDGLNEAIADLQAVVKPLASLFGKR